MAGMNRVPRFLLGGLGVAVLVALSVVYLSGHAARRDVLAESASPTAPRAEKLAKALKALQGKLAESRGRHMELAGKVPQRHIPYLIENNRAPGAEWTPEDQSKFDKTLVDATSDYEPSIHPAFPEEDQYVQDADLVDVFSEMREGYVEELLDWAEKGGNGDNSILAPLVESIEAPLIKQLDKEAHEKVAVTVRSIGFRKNLTPTEMKRMRARLLVPLLLRIRARVHHKVELYTVDMLRKIVLKAAGQKTDDVLKKEQNAVVPSAFGDSGSSDDEHLENMIRDINALYAKGAISKEDYEAEKAKVLSEWLAQSIRYIGGKKAARKALEDFLWPPKMTRDGCRCKLPFEFDVWQLKNRTVTYHRCTDIEIPGSGWCAVDPNAGSDPDCGTKSTDPRANVGPDGYGWTHWDYCLHQPKPKRLRTWKRRVVTEMGCTCKLPFEYKSRRGRKGSVYRLHTCTQIAGQVGKDWCATVGSCGRRGTPKSRRGRGRDWTHWDYCVGEPAGYLAASGVGR